jgi:hypothetical protein
MRQLAGPRTEAEPEVQTAAMAHEAGSQELNILGVIGRVWARHGICLLGKPRLNFLSRGSMDLQAAIPFLRVVIPFFRAANSIFWP